MEEVGNMSPQPDFLNPRQEAGKRMENRMQHHLMHAHFLDEMSGHPSLGTHSVPVGYLPKQGRKGPS